jgi:TonB family protein
MGLVAAVLLALACSGGTTRPGTAAGATGHGPAPPDFPSDFTPPPPLPDPPPPQPGKRGLSYLQKLYSRLAEPWHSFLENCRLRLPPAHALNHSALAVTLDLGVDRQGALHAITVQTSSGNPDFDDAAIEIARDAAPFPEPPYHLVSDDDLVHIRWLFARDQRQAGLATADIDVVQWPAERAVPRFLAAGDLTRAAERLAAAAAARPGNQKAWVELGHSLAVAAIREALRSDEPTVQRAAVIAAMRAKVVEVAPELRALVDTSVEATVRGQAIMAIGAIGDQGAGPLLARVLEMAKASGVAGSADSSIAAARALAAMGKGTVAESTVLRWLDAGDPESRWAALVIMTEFAVPPALSTLVAMAGNKDLPREDRMAACAGLGALAGADKSSAGPAMNVLRQRFAESDAAVRAACVAAVARAARDGVRNRAAYWKLVELIKKERDERVRAAAVRAAALLEPARFHQELYVLRGEKSPQVLAAMADGLAHVPHPTALARLVSLAGHEETQVRRQAAAALLEHAGSSARARTALIALIDDADLQVRVFAVRAIDDVERLRALLDDPATEVRAAAFAALVARQGRFATLPRMTQAIARSKPGSAERARWAMAWLLPGER